MEISARRHGLAGLVDAHVHLCADGTDGTLDRIGEPSADGIAAVIEQSLRRHLAAGVTAVRDLGRSPVRHARLALIRPERPRVSGRGSRGTHRGCHPAVTLR